MDTKYGELEYNKQEEQADEGCIYNDKETTLLKNDLKMLKQKVKHLTQDNEYMYNTIQSKEIQITELKSSISSYQNVQYLTEKFINIIGFKLKPILMGTMEVILEKNPSLLSEFINLASVNAEIAPLICVTLRLNNNDNNNTVCQVNNEKLLDRLTTSCLQKSLGKLIEVDASKEEIVQDLKPDMSITEYTDKQYVNMNKNPFVIVKDTEFSELTELCSEIKSDIAKLYEDLALDDLSQEDDTYIIQEISSHSFNMISVKEELNRLKEECLQISSYSQTVEKSSKKEKDFIKILTKNVKKLKQKISKKDIVINDLKNAITVGRKKLNDQEKEIKNCLSKINIMGIERAYFENEVKTCNHKISSLVNILSKFNTNDPLETRNLSYLIECISQEFKQSTQNRCLVTELTDSIRLFTTQYSLLVSYVKDLENKNISIQKTNASLTNETDRLKEHLTRTKNGLGEADIFLNQIISNIPCKISSIHQGMEVAKQIFSEYKTLKEKERMFFDDQKIIQGKLDQQSLDINSLEKYNSELKLQLESYENEIRNLRSKLRNLRRNEKYRVASTEQKIQTG